MILRILTSIFLVINTIGHINAQAETFYIFSNLDKEIDKNLLELYEKDIKESDTKSTILSLGDNDIEAITALQIISDNSKVRFITGDKDQSKLQEFRKLNEKKGYKFLSNGNYCPDPEVHKIDSDNIIIAINSNWFLDRDLQFTAKDKDCATFNELYFFEELESIIEDHEEKNIFLLAHHTTLSNTQLNGHRLWTYDFIPVVGNLYASYRRNIGRQQDLTSTRYSHYAQRMNDLANHTNVNIITGHDYINTIYEKELLRCINVNSGNESYPLSSKEDYTVYQETKPSYIKLTLNELNSSLELVSSLGRDITYLNHEELVNKESIKNTTTKNSSITKVAASEKYGSNKFKNWLLGTGYRKAWSTPVHADTLDILGKGLTPYGRGGGLQTKSIKFKDSENRKYAFRALDKEPEKSLSTVLQKSAYKKIVQELITTMHPYGPLVAHELIKETDIIHIQPKLHIMKPSQNGMGDYSDFDYKIGTLEEKPKGKRKNKKGFMGADEIMTTYQMLANLIKDADHRIDEIAYARARVFDMYIGDWDRHEDNWKWAMYEDGQSKSYKPIPKDRDHVFSKWTGLIPKVADLVVANAENFGETFGNLHHLNFKAFHLDRQLATELNAEDWQAAADYINGKMTDEVIENAITAFPIEVRDLHSEEIVKKLKSRRLDLNRAVYAHYCILAKEVSVAGSNKRDYFQIDRKENGNVAISIYKSNKDGEKKNKYYYREFTPDVTQTIYCFGLDGVDIFDINGEVEKSITIKIIGGHHKDQINDNSSVNGRSKSTQVYYGHGEDEIQNRNNELKIKKPAIQAYYDPYATVPNALLPLPSIRNSSGNGLGFSLSIQSTKQGYNKPLYAKIYKVNILYYPEIGAYRLDGSFKYRHIIGKSDFITKLRLSDAYDKFPFLYGIGSETTFDNEARLNGLYKLDYDYGRYDIGLSKSFFERSHFDNVLFTEYHGIEAQSNSGIIESAVPSNTLFYGYQSQLSLDFTDRPNYPTDGNKFTAKIETRISSKNQVTANLQSDISYYKSADIGIVTTLAAKVGYQASLGDANFYHLSSLGSNVGFRGYTRNRFLDKYAAFYNTELRFDLGTIQTPIIQMQIGTFILHDGGKIWNDDSSFGNTDWKSSYGAGFFIAPFSTEFAFAFSLIRSDDYDYYTRFKLGFSF